MPEQLITIAENIRAQILALAPDSVRALVEGLPPEGVLGAVAVVGLLLLWIIFSLLGAVFGGKKRRDEAEDQDDYIPESRFERSPEPVRDPAPQRTDSPRADPPRAPQPVAPAAGGDPRARYDDAIARGDKLAQANDHAAAANTYRQALDFARQIAFSQPDAVDAQRMVAKALHKVGDASARAGDGQVARQHHEQALVLLRRVYSNNTRDAGVARELAVTLERLGASAAAHGDRVSARQAFEEELRIAGAMAVQETSDLSWVRFKAVVHIMLGNLNDPDSRAHYEQARQLFETLERSGSIQSQDAQTLQQLRGVLGAA
ncbi:MAG: tetratricopeptide repeat protein [Hyphomonadaceae bacterium]|nr:tetratricopeptide repeat protein [Hyphomonadaceae bacterium]